ncbi:HD family hydrolase [Labrys monachus]|uniref:5'-deoxynucleotidase YfbR-like HD superfamily hydrolase n=1 Tax=Labrys monachus TaxID=217067 RepID=A0ABU0FC13_9HYPH|nr:HD family hydrolase [Labrys monachus]MDQ0391679.1 5'-deoxynucleotidase YfbR-like HD superfamily hydrolase [Labrys monachus]
MARARTGTTTRAWQRMLSGRRLDLLDPSPLDIEIEDIAHGLARVARWNGQTRGNAIFSVAQHSVLVCDVLGAFEPDAPASTKLMVLLHDAPEYVIGDMISPFKAVIGESYKAVEARLLSAIHIRFGLPAVPPPAIRALTKKADRVAAFLEATQLAGFGIEESCRYFGDPRPLPMPMEEAILVPQPAAEAQQAFLDRFAQLFR